MPISTHPEWLMMALYAGGAALLLILLCDLPYVGRALRFLLSVCALGAGLYMLAAQAPYDPYLSVIAAKLGLTRQEISGNELRISLAPDGHFWVKATINGIEKHMLVDSGATVTALSQATANEAGISPSGGLVPIVLRTANGTITAQTATIDTLNLGPINAEALPAVVSPALGNIDILGMNFLSQLESWRVEQRMLILVPRSNDRPTVS